MALREKLNYTLEDFKRIRKQLGVTQEEFSLLMGMSSRSVREWEHGNRSPKLCLCYLYRIAEKYPEVFMKL